MKNKDKYELSGKDEDLSERIGTSKRKYETVNVANEKKVPPASSKVVIPENIDETKLKDKTQPDFTSKYKTNYNTQKDYNKYDENTGNVDYNYYDTKEAIANGKDKSLVKILVLFCLIMFGVICAAVCVASITAITAFKEVGFESEAVTSVVRVENDGDSYSFDGDTCKYKDLSVELKENWLGEWAIFITNQGTMDYGTTDITIIFYNQNNEIVDLANEYFSVLPVNHTVAQNIAQEIEEFDRFEVFYDKEEAEQRASYGIRYQVEGVEFTNIKEKDYSIEYDVKNILGEKIDSISYMVLLYNGDELVYFSEGYESDLRKNETATDSIYIDEEIEYTKIDFIVNSIYVEK